MIPHKNANKNIFNMNIFEIVMKPKNISIIAFYEINIIFYEITTIKE